MKPAYKQGILKSDGRLVFLLENIRAPYTHKVKVGFGVNRDGETYISTTIPYEVVDYEAVEWAREEHIVNSYFRIKAVDRAQAELIASVLIQKGITMLSDYDQRLISGWGLVPPLKDSPS